jgi:xylulokinase
LAKLESRGVNHSASFIAGFHRRREIEYQPGILIQRKSDDSPRKTGMDDAAHPMAIGLDLGTSGVKAVLVWSAAACAPKQAARRPRNGHGRFGASSIRPTGSPRPTARSVHCANNQVRQTGLPSAHSPLPGQMHGAVLLDREKNLLRPAILWNDGRSKAQCDELERREPQLRRMTASRVMA